jgi:hypothetical protein
MSFDNNGSAANWQQPSWQQPSGQLNNGSAANWQQPSWQQPSGQLNNVPMPSWQQPSDQLNVQAPPQENMGSTGNQSMLPVPYQGGMELEPVGRQSTISLQLVPEHAVQHLIPANLEVPDTVHVPPMYTKPRPIIPKKRAVSGLLSMIIVALLLCTGASYYAKTSGTLDKVTAFISGNPAPPQNIQASAANIPDPQPQKAGPAANEVPSASLTSRINNSNQPIVEQNTFQLNQTFYVTFNAQPPQNTSGTVIAKWYTNNRLYYPQLTPLIKYDPTKTSNFAMSMQFGQPTAGRVELYWQPQAAKGKTAPPPQLAQTLYFAVK